MTTMAEESPDSPAICPAKDLSGHERIANPWPDGDPMRDHAMILPGTATETFVLFDTGGAELVRVSLARIVSNLERTPPTAIGSLYTAWRFNIT